jgi:hypothetical protein
MTLEDFILACDPLDCCACARLDVDPSSLRSSLPYYLREEIIADARGVWS